MNEQTFRVLVNSIRGRSFTREQAVELHGLIEVGFDRGRVKPPEDAIVRVPVDTVATENVVALDEFIATTQVGVWQGRRYTAVGLDQSVDYNTRRDDVTLRLKGVDA